MKLEEQINQAAPHAFLMEFEVDCLAKLMENFAIGFSEWLMVKCDYRPHCVWEYQGDEYTQKELLEIYKKQL